MSNDFRCKITSFSSMPGYKAVFILFSFALKTQFSRGVRTSTPVPTAGIDGPYPECIIHL